MVAQVLNLQISHLRWAWASSLWRREFESEKKARSALFNARRIELPSAAALWLCGPHFRWTQDTRTRYLLVVGTFGVLLSFSVQLAFAAAGYAVASPEVASVWVESFGVAAVLAAFVGPLHCLVSVWNLSKRRSS